MRERSWPSNAICLNPYKVSFTNPKLIQSFPFCSTGRLTPALSQCGNAPALLADNGCELSNNREHFDRNLCTMYYRVSLKLSKPGSRPSTMQASHKEACSMLPLVLSNQSQDCQSNVDTNFTRPKRFSGGRETFESSDWARGSRTEVTYRGRNHSDSTIERSQMSRWSRRGHFLFGIVMERSPCRTKLSGTRNSPLIC